MNTAVEKKVQREQVFAMWKRESAKGNPYFTGKIGEKEIRGFYNTNKKNLKEPDIRIYKLDKDGNLEKEEYLSLWCNASKKGTKVLSGTLDGKRVVGFVNVKATAENKQPYFSLYWDVETTEGEIVKPEAKTKKKKDEKPLETDMADLPF